jgi:hypothetical protein
MLDTSKQGISSLLIHFMNLFLAVSISKQNDDDACVWYFVNILLDTTIGVIFEWILVRVLEVIARKNKIEVLISGCYFASDTIIFDDYHIDYCIWATQAGIWCLISSLMKLFVYIIMLSSPIFLEDLGKSMLSSIAIYPRLELIIVMIIVPFIMNACQFWLVDNILKESDESRIERISRGKEKLIQVGPEYYNNQNN